MIGFRRWLLRPLLERQKHMTAALDRLTASVAANTSITASAVALISTIAGEIRNNVDDSDALNALADKLDAQSHDLADAVAANTPHGPSVVTDTPTPVPTLDSGNNVVTGQAPPADPAPADAAIPPVSGDVAGPVD